MVNAGRVACVFTPFILSLACLICLVIIFMGVTSSYRDLLRDFYFLKIDLTNFTLDPILGNSSSSSTSASTNLATALEQAKTALEIQDVYTIYLWNYCAWPSNTSTAQTLCSPRQAGFYFNPIDAWHLNSATLNVTSLLPTELYDGLRTYEAASKTMFALYVLALVSTIFTLVVGISAVFSRWGSFFTTFFAAASALFTLAASGVATALFVTIDGVLTKFLKPYEVHTSLGGNILRTTWVGTVFALGAGVFWLFSVCCCSGRSPWHKDDRGYGFRGVTGGFNDDLTDGMGIGRGRRRIKVEKTPYTYERVGSPYLGPRDSQHAVPLKDLRTGTFGLGFGENEPRAQRETDTAYEPFRAAQI